MHDDRRRPERPAGDIGGESRQRLERALEDVVVSAGDHLSESAIRMVEDTADRLRESANRQRRGRAAGADDDDYWLDRDADGAADRPRRRGRRRSTDWSEDDGRLRRNREDGWFGGVCAGLGDYFGVDIWIVRVVVISLLLFSPVTGIVMLVYVFAWFLIPSRDIDRRRSRRRGGAGRSRGGASRAAGTGGGHDARSASGPAMAPRGALRQGRARLNSLELKLRRLESCVTSKEFELRREFARMDA